MKLQRVSRYEVRPDARVLLTPNDEDMQQTHGIVILLFTQSAAVPISKVKDSFAQVLQEYRELAGRLVVDEAGRGAIELSDKGAPFVEAISDCALEDVLQSRDFTSLIPLDESEAAPEELLLVQYTSFKCGGIALGIAGHHRAIDACAFWTFMDSWAKVARGVQLDWTPIHDRSAFMPREPLQFQHESIGATVPAISSVPAAPVLKRVPLGRVHLTRDELQRLKSKSAHHTTFECLAGHLWRCAVKALGIASGENKTTTVSILINGRNLLSLPRGFFGNALCLAFPTCSVEQLLKEPPSFAAKVIHDSIKEISAEGVRSEVDMWEFLRRKGEHLQDMGLKPVDVSINSWAGFPMYNCDLGKGNPAFASIAHRLDDRTIFIQPSPPTTGGFEVLVALQQEHLTAMLPTIKDF